MREFCVYFLFYLTVVSLISIILVVLDKHKARKRRFRIPENVLFIFAFLGGSVAMYLTMCLVRHKTQKNSFVFGIPLIFALQCVVCYYIYKNLC